MTPVFELNSVCAGYGGDPVLRNLSMTVGAGEFVSVIGPNGAGKSTFIRVLDGTVRPTAGSIRFNGRDIRDYSPRAVARGFSVVHQMTENVVPFTVYEFVRLGRFPHQGLFEIETPRDREAVDWAAGVTGITGLLKRPLTDLSGGELQLVRIAHALAQNHDIILLDEPISHLDIRHSVMIMDILHGLNGSGSTVVAVLHDINVASDYSSRIVGMREGGIFFDGPPGTVITYPFMEELFGARCIVVANPTTGRPFVYPVPGHIQGKENGD
jgi:iron complex transport system ATP-binding protein